MSIYNPDRVIAQTLLQLMEDDMDHMDAGGADPTILVPVALSGRYVPLDWIEKYAGGFKDAWEKFMEGQTYCEYGFYFSDVTRFLRSKVRK